VTGMTKPKASLRARNNEPKNESSSRANRLSAQPHKPVGYQHAGEIVSPASYSDPLDVLSSKETRLTPDVEPVRRHGDAGKP